MGDAQSSLRRFAALRVEPSVPLSQAEPAAAIAGVTLNEFFEWIGRDPIKAPPLIGRTVKPSFLGPCKQCGERRFFCGCEDEL
jgi:hypothetical protein